MADSNSVNIGVIVSDNGTVEKLTKNVQNLRDLLINTAAIAAKINLGGSGGTGVPNIPQRTVGGGGSAAIASATGAMGGGSAAAAGAAGAAGGGRGGSAVGTYGAQRGVSGGTGSSTSDFAEEARGLDGLVRAYAVVAANVYAASAAFHALGEAMNTTHLVQGLEQLGVASGRNLPLLAKQLQDVTGHALDTRQSMQAVAQMSASNMSSANILKLGVVARNASQALGRDMAEAVDRLSLGISKQQPRLLDELGILVNVTKAHADYALKINKSASQLTDFENRQAFANAVLDQGMKKFGAIDIDTNPYQRLTASINALIQSALELANKVLGPLVAFFADNKAALTALGVVITSTLVGMAVPALAKWGTSLSNLLSKTQLAAAASLEMYAAQSLQAEAGGRDIVGLTTIMNGYTDSILKAKVALSTMNMKAASPLNANFAGALTRVAEAPTGMASAVDLAATKAGIDALILKTNELKAANSSMHAEQILANEKIIAQSNIIYKNQTFGSHMVGPLQQAQGAYAAGGASKPGYFSQEAGAGRQYAADKSKALLAEAVVAGTTAGQTITKTLTNVTDVALKQDGIFKQIGTTLAGTMAAGVKSVGSFLAAAAGPLLMWGTLAVLAFELLDSAFSNNKKQAEASNKALTNLNSNSDLLDKTMESMSKKNPFEQLSTESLIAKSNAILAVAESLQEVGKTALNSAANMGYFDYAVEGVKRLAGKDIISEADKAFIEKVPKLLAGLPSGESKNKAVKGLTKILGVDPTDVAAMKAAEGTFTIKQRQEADTLLVKTAKDFANVTSRAKELDDTFTALNKDYDSLLTSLVPSDHMAKIGMDMLNLSGKMSLAFKDPVVALSQLNKAIDDVDILKHLDPGFAKTLIEQKDFIKANTSAYIEQSAKLAELNKEEEKLNVRKGQLLNLKISPQTREMQYPGQMTNIDNSLAAIGKAKEGMAEGIAKNKAYLDVFLAQYTSQQNDAFLKGSKLLEVSIGQGFQKGAITINTAYAGALGDTLGGIELKADLQKEAIRMQLRQIDTTILLMGSQSKLIATQEESNALQKEANLQKSGLPQADIDKEMSVLRDFRAIMPMISKQYIEGKGTLAQLNAELAKGKKEGYAEGTMRALQAAVPVVAQREQLAASRSQTAAGIKAIDIGTDLAKIDHKAKIETQIEQSKLEQFNTTKNILDLYTKTMPYLDKQTLAAKQLVDSNILQEQQTIELISIQARRNKYLYDYYNATDVGVRRAAIASLIELNAEDELLSKRQRNQRTILAIQAAQAVITNEYNKQVMLANNEYAIVQQTQALKSQDLSNAENILQVRSGLGLIYGDELLSQEKLLKLKRADSDETIAVNEAEKKYQDTLKKIAADKASSLAAGPPTAEAEKGYEQQKVAAQTAYDAENILIKRKSAGIREATELQYSYNTRTKEYAKVFESSFDSMNDAIVEFAKTGKISFKSLIDDMIGNLIKFELKQAEMKMFEGAGGFGGFINSMLNKIGLGTTPAGSAGSSNMIDAGITNLGTFAAKGGAYDNGIKTFSMGGAFANSIVDSPTLFKFASGTGLMGEAGPEAIMPLKRDSSGNLGVRTGGSGGSVAVVVNNYGNEKATTKETTDSRGNRKVEVIIGDMSASQLTRSGSSSQKSLQTTYGLQPSLIRR